MSTPKIVLVVAVAENGVIGNANALPWRLPGDLRHFKEATLGKPVIMGRRTFDSIGRALPGRPNIVVTRDTGYAAEGIHTASSFERALAIATEEARRVDADEIAVIGGAALYAEALPHAHCIDLTEVHASPSGDVTFPALDRNAWREAARDGPHRGPGDEHSYSFVKLERR